jgi:hypothetical protein
MISKKAVLATVAAVGVLGSALGFGAATAGANEAPGWAPRKPAETWQGQPVVWWDGDPTPGGHWGVWINGGFINLT